MPYKRKTFKRKCKKLSKCEVKEVKKIIAGDIETKYFGQFSIVPYGVTRVGVTLPAVTPIPLTGSYTHIEQGVRDDERVGQRISLTDIDFRYKMDIQDGFLGSTDPFTWIRVIMFRWMQDSLAYPPDPDELFGYGNLASVTGPQSVMLPFNKDVMAKYHILYDKTHMLSDTPVATGSTGVLTYADGPTSRSNIIRVHRTGKRVGRRLIQFTNNIPRGSPGATNDGIGHLYVMCLSNSNAAIYTPTIEVTIQIGFKDA